MQQSPMMAGIGPLVIWAVLGIGLAIGNYFLAHRLNANPTLWAVLSLIPLVNFVFFYYVGYRVIYAILDRLPQPVTRPMPSQ